MSFDKMQYDKLITQNSLIDSTKFTEPYPYVFAPKRSDFKKGFAVRYFCIHRLNRNIIEIDVKQDAAFESPDKGPNQHLWKNFKIKWKLRGPLHDIKDKGVIVKKGVIDTNIRSIRPLEKMIPEIKHYLTDLSRYAQIERDPLPYIPNRFYPDTKDPIPPSLPKAYRDSNTLGHYCNNCKFKTEDLICTKWEAKILKGWLCNAWIYKNPEVIDPSTTNTNTTTGGSGGSTGGSGGSTGGSGGY